MKDDLFQEIHGRKLKDDLSQEIHGQKMKDDLSQKTHGNMIFSVHMYKCYKYMILPLCQKKPKMIFSRENTLKVDRHSRLTF